MLHWTRATCLQWTKPYIRYPKYGLSGMCLYMASLEHELIYVEEAKLQMKEFPILEERRILVSPVANCTDPFTPLDKWYPSWEIVHKFVFVFVFLFLQLERNGVRNETKNRMKIKQEWLWKLLRIWRSSETLNSLGSSPHICKNGQICDDWFEVYE